MIVPPNLINALEQTAAHSAEPREALEGPGPAGGMMSRAGAMEPSRLRLDPRVYQIAALSVLLVYGYARLQFDIAAENVALILCVALATQYFFTRLWNLPVFDSRSALISGLSLSLLLRANSIWWFALAAAASIAAKFVLRWNGKHLFNPTNFGLVAMMLWPGGNVWVCPGQWGNCAFFGFLLICLGGIVVNRARRADVTFAFLACYLALVFGRSTWLGEPVAIPLHRIENGALLIFAFFMISDPRTTPDSRPGRILFAGLVAFGGWYVQYQLFRTNGLLWSLAGFALAGPVIDFLFPGDRFEWRRSKYCRSTTVANFRRPSGPVHGHALT
jgi:Na+-transporting NADH:ubiquinone oxidoreductase subunit NqrB